MWSWVCREVIQWVIELITDRECRAGHREASVRDETQHRTTDHDKHSAVEIATKSHDRGQTKWRVTALLSHLDAAMLTMVGE
jgi:hypothetical protein